MCYTLFAIPPCQLAKREKSKSFSVTIEYLGFTKGIILNKSSKISGRCGYRTSERPKLHKHATNN